MTITGKGNYQGTFTKDYTIAPKNLAEPEVKIAPIDAQEYNGMAVTPVPSVSYEFGDGTYALSPVNDYTVAYANNKGTGTATVTVTPEPATLPEARRQNSELASSSQTRANLRSAARHSPTAHSMFMTEVHLSRR